MGTFDRVVRTGKREGVIMAKRKKDFGVDGFYTEHLTTANLREARLEARKLVDAGFLAKITRVQEKVPRGERVFFVVWQRGKLGIKGKVGYGITEAIFGKQKKVF